MKTNFRFFALSLLSIQALATSSSAAPGPVVLDFDFSRGHDHEFVALFRDLPTSILDEYTRRKMQGISLGPVAPLERGAGEYPEDHSHWLLNSGIFPLPDRLPGYGFLVQGTNRSDDLDYGLGKLLDRSHGLEPNTEYIATFKVDIGGNAGGGGIGAGGGQTINLAAVMTNVDPNKYVVAQGYAKWPREILQQLYNAPGIGSNVVCTVGMPMPGMKRCPAGRIPFQVRRGFESKPLRFRTDAKGEAWLVIAGHSGYEAFAAFYFTRVQVKLRRAAQ